MMYRARYTALVMAFGCSFACDSLRAQSSTSAPRRAIEADSATWERFASVTYDRTARSAVISHTATEWGYRIFLANTQALVSRSPDALFAKDSVRAALGRDVREWIAAERTSPRGLQLDTYGEVLVVGELDTAARTAFRTRLGSSGTMTTTDSALTLIAAVRAFADADDSVRRRTAEEYLTRLDALGPAADVWKAQGHQLLAYVNFLAGDTARMTAHAMRTVERLPTLFFNSRISVFTDANTYLSLVDMLRQTPQGKLRVDSLNQRLLAAAVPANTLIAQDSAFYWTGQSFTMILQRTMRLGALLGTAAPAVRGTTWLNVPDTNEHAMVLNDGTVRIIGIGSQRTTLYALPAFQRILASPGVSGRNAQALYHVSTQGYWGSRSVTPAEETAQLVTYFTKIRPTSVPVAIWAGEKESLYDGRVHPAESPTVTAFRAFGAQTYVIVDQHGNVRAAFLGPFGPDEEAVATAVIKNLLSESSRPSSL
jgi:hypothetical protein